MAKGETYEEFVKKFDVPKTTDDCMTPDSVYESVKNWVLSHYHLPEDTIIVRPFWPGADYAAYPYNGDELVLDNPPFSILAKILDFYNARGIRYFLFAPGLTCFNHIRRSHIVITGSTVTYANGARVSTGFCTNLPGPELLISGELANILRLIGKSVPLQKVDFPPNVWNSGRISRIAKNGLTFEAQKVEEIANLDLGGGGRSIIFSAEGSCCPPKIRSGCFGSSSKSILNRRSRRVWEACIRLF